MSACPPIAAQRRTNREVRPIVLKKSFFADGRKILRTAGASFSLRGEGPHQLPQKRSLALVSILQSLAAAEIANALYSRGGAPRFLEFFNTIGQKQTSPGTALLFRQPSLSQADEKPFTVFWTAERSDEPRVAQGQSR
jgi:hypothetical protein